MVYRGSHVIVFKVSCVASKCIKCFIEETSMLRILSLQSPSKIAQEHEIIAQLPPRPLSDPELLASMLESLLESAARDVEDAGRLDLSVLKKRPVGRGDSGGIGFIIVGPRSALAVNSSSKYSEPRSAAKAPGSGSVRLWARWRSRWDITLPLFGGRGWRGPLVDR